MAYSQSVAAIERTADQSSVDTYQAKMQHKIGDATATEQSPQRTEISAPFQIDSPQKLKGVIYEQLTISERPEDESMLLKGSGLSLNTTNLVGNPLMDDDLESVLSLYPERLDLTNLN